MDNYIKLTVSKNYGAGGTWTVEVSHAKQVDDKSLVEFNAMVDQVNSYFEHFEINRMGEVRGATLPNPPTTTKWFKATEIRVKMDNKGKFFSIPCGEWQEFGIAFWPEHMLASGIKPDKVPLEGYKFKKEVEAEIEFVGGKAKRVLRVRETQ